MNALRVVLLLALPLAAAACGVLQTGTARTPSGQAPVGIVRDAEAVTSKCRAECDGRVYSIGCPGDEVPRCQCDIQPYAACLPFDSGGAPGSRP